MYRNLCVALSLLFVAFGLMAARSAGVADSLPATPQIIQRVNLPDQTAPIPTTTLFTPTQGGLYRISAYMTASGELNGGWTLSLQWRDDFAAEGTDTAMSVSGR